MTYEFTTRSGVRVTRTATALPFDQGLRTLATRLDTERGALFSSGFEYPDRYSRWEMGFAAPPLEFVGFGRRLEVRALNDRGVALLEYLCPCDDQRRGRRATAGRDDPGC